MGSSHSSLKAWPKEEVAVAPDTTRWRAVCGQGVMWEGGGGRQPAAGGGRKKVEYLPYGLFKVSDE